MDFTREPIIETIITPREGHKLAIRNSKGGGQEEHFVDAVEIVSFGLALFFRSIERPKAFLVPVSDYEVLEVREARVVLKNMGMDRSIKIGGGRESSLKVAREVEKGEFPEEAEALDKEKEEAVPLSEAVSEEKGEVKIDKKRERRRHYRKRRGKEEAGKEEEEPSLRAAEKVGETPAPEPEQEKREPVAPLSGSGTLFSSLLQPPPTLISETISRYRQNESFKGAFYLTEEEQYKPHDKVQDLLRDDEEDLAIHLKEPIFGEEEPERELPPEEKQEETLRETEEEGASLQKEPEEQEEFSSFWEEGVDTFSSLYEEEERAKKHLQDFSNFNEPESHH